MKICMVGYTVYEMDGRLHRYAMSLMERGDTVHVVANHSPGSPRVYDVKGVRVNAVSSRDYRETSPLTYLRNMLEFFFSSMFILSRLHLKEKYDVIHYHNIPDFGIFCVVLPKLLGAKVILDIHDLVPEFYMRKFHVSEQYWTIRILKWVEKISCRFANHVITVTDIWRERLIARSTKAEKCSVIMNLPIGTVFERLPFRTYETGEPFILCYHGNIAEQTGIDVAVRAILLLRSKIPNIQLKIIGGGRDAEKIRVLIQELALADHVTIIPYVPVETLPNLLKDAYIAVDPKREGVYAGETLSVKSMEYLRLGIPLIASSTVAARHYFDTRFVYFVEPNNPKSLADAIWDLYSNPQKRKTLSENSDLFTQQYNWEKTKQIYYHILDTLHTC